VAYLETEESMHGLILAVSSNQKTYCLGFMVSQLHIYSKTLRNSTIVSYSVVKHLNIKEVFQAIHKIISHISYILFLWFDGSRHSPKNFQLSLKDRFGFRWRLI